ncbi:hypothetical protein GAY20_03605 [Pantoea dispersa]|uniref:Uncharacterized protein n=1 Tax=Pantoea dispersa TaxID=59814 RepID=A0ABY3A0T1_9GAMM|nr:hypothetical protein [Pantoea sp. Pent]NIG16483.1 hypothetical protein [Pantoea sp. Cy-640]NIG35034.1 hypothetical protein [Pantoea sp. Ap-959]QFS62467.1 hypothetical protein GAY20_03605 [Pantoea dispersa]THD29696.1 hypothetical protein ERD80_21095 [Pantoea sp. R102]
MKHEPLRFRQGAERIRCALAG